MVQHSFEALLTWCSGKNILSCLCLLWSPEPEWYKVQQGICLSLCQQDEPLKGP